MFVSEVRLFRMEIDSTIFELGRVLVRITGEIIHGLA